MYSRHTMAISELSRFELGDMRAIYLLDEDTHQVGYSLMPVGVAPATRRETLHGQMEVELLPDHMGYPRAWAVDPVVHISLADGLGPGGFSRGKTMRGSPSQRRLVYRAQSETASGDAARIETRLASEDGLVVVHRLVRPNGASFVLVEETIANEGDTALTINMISSFTLSHLTPFAPDDAPGRLSVHRFRADWSAEGRHERRTVEELGLERSWLGHGVRNERFGQVGTMPVRGWFPTVLVEDSEASVFWGASLAWAGSWQIELYRKDDCLNISGGLADREFGHWFKTLAPGETFEPPSATLTTCIGDLDTAATRLADSHQSACEQHPEPNDELPVIFNEWCTSWGNPTEANLTRLADALSGEGVRYLVIDAGWYKPPEGVWSNAQGDWQVSGDAFPHGLSAATEAIRRRGLVPGLWFEYECIGRSSKAWTDDAALHLRLGGVPIDSGGRRFWDMRRDETHELLESRVIDLIAENGIGYLKIDYNETTGYGADGEESDGEAIRRQVLGSYRFLERIRERLPDLVIENCSSGGHRLEASMIGRTAMSSFSDAHECREIPIIAANLQRLLLPRQSQVWAVLHRLDPPKRLIYSLASGFLGRLCLSGEITDLTDVQWNLVRSALALYRAAAGILLDGESVRFGPPVPSYRHPVGWQSVVRRSRRDGQVLVVVHRFGGDSGEISFPIDGSEGSSAAFHVSDSLYEVNVTAELEGRTMHVRHLEEFSAAVYLLAPDPITTDRER